MIGAAAGHVIFGGCEHPGTAERAVGLTLSVRPIVRHHVWANRRQRFNVPIASIGCPRRRNGKEECAGAASAISCSPLKRLKCRLRAKRDGTVDRRRTSALNVRDAADGQGLWPATTEPSPLRFVYHAILTSILFLLVANAPISLAVWLKTGTMFFLLVPNPLANLVIATAGLCISLSYRAKLTAVRSPWPLFWYVAAAVLLPLVAIVAQFEFANWHVFHALWHGR